VYDKEIIDFREIREESNDRAGIKLADTIR